MKHIANNSRKKEYKRKLYTEMQADFYENLYFTK